MPRTPYDPFPRADYSRAGYSPGGDTILALIQGMGQSQADAARRSGELWSNALTGIGQTLSQGYQQYQQEKQQTQAGEYATALQQAQSEGAGDVFADLLNSIPPELKPRVQKSLADANGFATAFQEHRLELQKKHAELEKLQQENQQRLADYGGSIAEDLKPFLKGPDGGLGAVKLGLAHAKQNGIPVGEYGQAVQDAEDLFAAAQKSGDPAAMQAAAERMRSTFAPMLDQMSVGMSADARKKRMEATPQPIKKGAEEDLIDPVTHEVLVAGAPKRETRSLDVQAAEAAARGDTETVARLAAIKKQFAEAGHVVNVKTGGGGKELSPTAESNIINRLSGQYIKASGSAGEVSRQVKLMDAGLEAARRGDMAAGSQAVLVTFQKILDPESVVRESEYMRSAAGQSLLNRIEGAFDKLTKGGAGVPLSELEKYAKLAREAAAAQSSGLGALRDRIGKTADRYNIPRELVMDELSGGGNAGAGAAPGAPAPPKVGEVVRGYRFKGGNPADPKSWEKQ